MPLWGFLMILFLSILWGFIWPFRRFRYRKKPKNQGKRRWEEGSIDYSSKYAMYTIMLFFSCSVLSDSLQPHVLQHVRFPCPSLSPRDCSCPLSRWCHPTIASCRPLFLLPSIIPSIRIFSNQSALHTRWQKYWSFSISPSNEYSGLISFSIDWFDLLAVQGTLKSLLQHHSLKATILWHSAFFMVQICMWLLEKP